MTFHHYDIEINFFSCSPSWADPDSMSFIIYIFMIGYIIPHIIIVVTSVKLLDIHKDVRGWFQLMK